jgi:putative NADPH-quinone reductase
MQVLLILAHPKPDSFNHAIAQTVADAVRRLGHQVTLRDLYREGFDPCLSAAELERDTALPDAIEAQVKEVCAADALVFVHPNYWSRPPAILCGWEDRVLRAGRAYQFVPDGQGGARPEGLLKARTGFVFNTANTPQEKEEALLGDPLEVHWRKVVFGLCGIPRLCRRVFSPVIVSTPGQRAAWLREAAQTVEAELDAVAD